MLRQILLSEFTAETWESVSGWALLAARFPGVSVQPLAAGEGAQVLSLDVEEWHAPGFEPSCWDQRIFSAASAERLALHLVGARGAELAATALEILTRYQGLIGLRNAASSSASFDQLLERHRALYDLRRASSRSHYQRALDTWQWMLRLEPEAELAVQVAALFRENTDVSLGAAPPELSPSELGELLSELGLDAATRERVRGLITRNAHAREHGALELLEDASTLSFYSLHSPGFPRSVQVPLPHALAAAQALPRPRYWRSLEWGALAPRVRTLLHAWRHSLTELLPAYSARPEPV